MPTAAQYAAEYKRRQQQQPTPKPSVSPTSAPNPIPPKRPTSASPTASGSWNYIQSQMRGGDATETPAQATYRTNAMLAQSEQAARRQQPFMPPASSGGGDGGGGYRGGGGSASGRGVWACAPRQAPAAVEDLLAPQIAPAAERDRAAAMDAFRRARGAVSMDDPYLALLQSTAPSTDAGLGGFAASQGVDGGDLAAAQRETQASIGGVNANWNALAQALGANQRSAQQDVLELMGTQEANTLSGIDAARSQMEMAARVRQQQVEAQRQQALEDMRRQKIMALMELMQQGMQFNSVPDVSGVAL